jgi:hypothetical protein
MGRMNLDDLEAGYQGPLRGGLERSNDRINARIVQRNGRRVAVVERDWAGAYHFPAALIGSENSPTPPGGVAAGLSTGVGQLDARGGSLRLNEPNDPSQWLNVLIAPDTQVAG